MTNGFYSRLDETSGSGHDFIRGYEDLIREAVNVREVMLTTDLTGIGTRQIKVNPKLGARIGSSFKEVLTAQRAGEWQMLDDGRVQIANLVLEQEDFEIRIQVADGLAAEPFDSWRGVVVLDTNVYSDLKSEGWARDFIRLVQNARKTANLYIADRIHVELSGASELVREIEKHRDYVCAETLGTMLSVFAEPLSGDRIVSAEIDDLPVHFRIDRVAD